ncbi:hypothetical protein I4U23_025352 [Adineta vaga]|nr:hypothetical protein I4U23_025352 [Adineta vaga]
MVTRCLFGIFVFEKNSSLVYRFLTNDLFTYLQQSFIDRGYSFDENNQNDLEINFSIDDVFVQHFSTLLTFYEQTLYRKSPIRQITLQSHIRVYFDLIGENRVICMVDESFGNIVVLKAINLFKTLVKFHLGALPFTKSKTVGKLINRISASLQYYLNNILTNQALVFESCEYLLINSLIHQQCSNTCTILNKEVESLLHTIPTFTLITCKDKIVYMHFSNEQYRLSNSDIFLLLLNNTSRRLRNQFKLQKNPSSNIMAHIYKTNNDIDHQNLTSSARELTDDIRFSSTRRTLSLPNFPPIEISKTNENRRIEVVFMKTSNKSLVPFTMYTIQLTNEVSALILVEWKSSSACSILSEFIHQLDFFKTQSRFIYTRLSNHIRSIETNAIIRRYFENRKLRTNFLSTILNDSPSIYKSSRKTKDIINEEDDDGQKILINLSQMTDYSIKIFHHLFFESDEYALENDQQIDLSIGDDSLIESSFIQILRNKLCEQLGDWFSFIEIKAQRNITMNFFHNDFPGLVHFAFIDRFRGQIFTPGLYTDEFQQYMNNHGLEHLIEKKILAFELECLSALKRGCSSYTVTDEYFTYNYTLRLQESNGASMRVHKPFVEYQPPGILYFDFYKALAYENYSSMIDKTSIGYLELICVHLRIVPPSIVLEQCEKLWPRLTELDEQ